MPGGFVDHLTRRPVQAMHRLGCGIEDCLTGNGTTGLSSRRAFEAERKVGARLARKAVSARFTAPATPPAPGGVKPTERPPINNVIIIASFYSRISNMN